MDEGPGPRDQGSEREQRGAGDFRHRRPSTAAGCRYSTASAFSISSWPPGTFSAKLLYDVSWAMARQAAASSADMLTTSTPAFSKTHTALSSHHWARAIKSRK